MNAKLVAMRKSRKLQQKEVAAAVGMSPAAICYYENGREPKPEIRKKLADFFGCEEGELFGNYMTLEQAAMPLIEYLRRNGDAHMTAVVTQEGVTIAAEMHDKKMKEEYDAHA